jgi:nitroreductase
MRKNYPDIILEKACMSCGHCTAVCPANAIDNAKAPVANQVPLKGTAKLDAPTAASFLRSRRSIRCFRPESVPREKLNQLLDIARFAPSGSNAQGVSYIVVENPQTLKKIIEVTVDWLEEQISLGLDWTKPYAGVPRIYRRTGRDVILRNAPHLILATTSSSKIGLDNALFALAYAELYAPTLGLGTCWSGFIELCTFANYLPLINLIQVPKGKQVAGAIMVGYPKYSYHRLVDRNPLQIDWI